MEPQQEHSLIMKALCGLLFLFAIGMLALAAMAADVPTTHEGRPLYDCTQPVSPEVAALASLPIGQVGHNRKFIRRRSLQLTKKRKKKGGR